jgi:hypothetical protein
VTVTVTATIDRLLAAPTWPTTNLVAVSPHRTKPPPGHTTPNHWVATTADRSVRPAAVGDDIDICADNDLTRSSAGLGWERDGTYLGARGRVDGYG